MSSRHSHSENYSPQREKCRACSDFKSWAKQQTLSHDDKSSNKTVEQINNPKECPLDREELGRTTWSFLHTMAAYFPDQPSPSQQKQMTKFMKILPEFYPCKDCADDFKTSITKNPPVVTSQESFSQWMCRMHNEVNIKLGKPIYDCSKVAERWRNGWKDGSCD